MNLKVFNFQPISLSSSSPPPGTEAWVGGWGLDGRRPSEVSWSGRGRGASAFNNDRRFAQLRKNLSENVPDIWVRSQYTHCGQTSQTGGKHFREHFKPLEYQEELFWWHQAFDEFYEVNIRNMKRKHFCRVPSFNGFILNHIQPTNILLNISSS